MGLGEWEDHPEEQGHGEYGQGVFGAAPHCACLRKQPQAGWQDPSPLSSLHGAPSLVERGTQGFLGPPQSSGDLWLRGVHSCPESKPSSPLGTLS